MGSLRISNHSENLFSLNCIQSHQSRIKSNTLNKALFCDFFRMTIGYLYSNIMHYIMGSANIISLFYLCNLV